MIKNRKGLILISFFSVKANITSDKNIRRQSSVKIGQCFRSLVLSSILNFVDLNKKI